VTTLLARCVERISSWFVVLVVVVTV
jgi:hypothetical protein